MYKLLLQTPFLHSKVNFFVIVLGVFGRTGTPDPIPNSAVKRPSADGTLTYVVSISFC